MDRFKDWNSYDFLQDKAFVRWCRDSSGEGAIQLEKLCALYPDKREQLMQAKELIQSLRYEEQLTEEELRQLWSAIRERRTGELPKIVKRTNKWKLHIPYAAAVLFCITCVVYLQISRLKSRTERVVQRVQLNDLKPVESQAILSLSDGSQLIMRDSVWTRQEAGVTIQQTESGELIYQTDERAEPQIAFHTLRTPKGKRYPLQLPDGTKVWLNANSSLRFPVQPMLATERLVQLQGEAYFEVAKLKNEKGVSIPFKVQLSSIEADQLSSDDVQITVLGTHFNVSAYEEDETVKASLLEGSIRITKGVHEALLEPGQQAVLTNKNTAIAIHDVPDLQNEIAWTRGFFQFDQAPLSTIMNEIGRWYDAKISFQEDKLKRQVYSVYMISGGVPVSRILQLLELTGNVNFKLEELTIQRGSGELKKERRITVIP